MRPVYVGNHFYLPGGKGKGSLKSAGAHLQYMGNPKKEELLLDSMESAAIHSKYMVERPGSAGYFSQNPEDRPEADNLYKKIAHHKGPVWRLIVSVTEEDALALGGQLMTRPGWEEAVRRTMPKVAASMGIELKNLEWAAAMHRKDGHPHVHLLFWEKKPKRVVGKWTKTELEKSRQLWARELYAPERNRLNREKSEARNELTAGVRSLLGGKGKAQDSERLPSLTSQQAAELGTLLGTVKDGLPGKGRLSYAFMPPETKIAIGKTTDWLLSNVPRFGYLADRFADLNGELAQHFSDAAPEAAKLSARQDLTERMATAVLRAAMELDRRIDQKATATVIWHAVWPAKDGDPQVRQALLALADAVRTGKMTSTDAAKTLIAGSPDLQREWKTQTENMLISWMMPEDTQKAAKRKTQHTRKAPAGSPITHLPWDTTAWDPKKAKQSTEKDIAIAKGLLMPHSPQSSMEWSAYTAKPSAHEKFIAQVARAVTLAAELRAQQLAFTRALMAQRLLGSVLRGLLSANRGAEAEAEYLAKKDEWARKSEAYAEAQMGL